MPNPAFRGVCRRLLQSGYDNKGKPTRTAAVRAWTLSTTGMSQTLAIISMAAFQYLLVAIKLHSPNQNTPSVLVTRPVRALYHFTHTQTFTNHLSHSPACVRLQDSAGLIACLRLHDAGIYPRPWKRSSRINFARWKSALYAPSPSAQPISLSR